MNKNLKCKKSIITLSLLGLTLLLLDFVAVFIDYGLNGDAIVFDFFSMVLLVLKLTSIVLFILYVAKFHTRSKGTVMITISFGLFAGCFLLSSIFSGKLINLALAIVFVLLTIDAVRGLNQKVFVIVATSVGIVLQFFDLFSVFQNIFYLSESGNALYIFTGFAAVIGKISIYVAILLFGLNNSIPSIVTNFRNTEVNTTDKIDS